MTVDHFMKPFISVVIPTLNEERYISRLLKSLTLQTNKNFEVIIVDAHSEDKTYELCKNYKKKLKMKIVRARKRAVSYQKNLGVKHARGTHLVFIDADAKVERSCIARVYQFVERGIQLALPWMVPQGSTTIYVVTTQLVNEFILFSQRFSTSGISQSMLYIEKRVFRRIGGFRGEKKHLKGLFFPEDHDLVIRAKKSGVKVYMAPFWRVFISLRRFEQEGRLKTLLRYIYSTFSLFMMGRGKDQFEDQYSMGGQQYKPMPFKRRKIVV